MSQSFGGPGSYYYQSPPAGATPTGGNFNLSNSPNPALNAYYYNPPPSLMPRAASFINAMQRWDSTNQSLEPLPSDNAMISKFAMDTAIGKVGTGFGEMVGGGGEAAGTAGSLIFQLVSNGYSGSLELTKTLASSAAESSLGVVFPFLQGYQPSFTASGDLDDHPYSSQDPGNYFNRPAPPPVGNLESQGNDDSGGD